MKRRRSLAVLCREAWKLRDELDAAAIRAAGTKLRRSPEGVQRALSAAVAALYFREDHKYEGKFHTIIRALDPDLYKVLDERGAQAAYDVVHPEDK